MLIKIITASALALITSSQFSHASINSHQVINGFTPSVISTSCEIEEDAPQLVAPEQQEIVVASTSWPGFEFNPFLASGSYCYRRYEEEYNYCYKVYSGTDAWNCSRAVDKSYQKCREEALRRGALGE